MFSSCDLLLQQTGTIYASVEVHQNDIFVKFGINPFSSLEGDVVFRIGHGRRWTTQRTKVHIR